MSLFFNSQAIVPAASAALQNALNTNPHVANPQQTVLNLAEQVKAQVTGNFAVGRFLAALFFLALLFAGGIYTAQHEQLKEWSTVLLHTFEVALGGVVGIVIGEKTGKN